MKLFSIKDDENTHLAIEILGIRFKVLKGHIKKEKIYFQKNTDITKVSKAEGLLRQLQLAELMLVKEVDRVCSENGLQYWLDWGTLLGAYRHKGFIPWDDDIDMAMMRDDFEKFEQIFNEKTHDKNIYCEVFKDKSNPCKYFLKIKHKILKQIAADIFIMDYHYKHLNPSEKRFMTKFWYVVRKLLCLKKNPQFTQKQQYERMLSIRDKFILNNHKPNKENKPDIFYGLDFSHNFKEGFLDYDMIFPLKRVPFENAQLCVPNKDFEVLVAEFKTPMAFPKYMYAHHIDKNGFTAEELNLLKEIEDKFNNKK